VVCFIFDSPIIRVFDGSETWPLKVEHESRLESTDMRMIRWMCGVSLRDRIHSEDE
jgi:hypothetical protein